MNVKLLLLLGKTIKRQLALQLPCVVGRSRDADVTVTHPLISRRHCEISEANGLLMLRDLSSLNGTMIGGRRITSAPLLPGDEFAIGPLTFRVLYEYDGDLDSVPTPGFAESVERNLEISLDDLVSCRTVESPKAPADQVPPAKPANRSESSEIVIPNFMDLADADPEAVIPALPAGNPMNHGTVPTDLRRPLPADDDLSKLPSSDAMDEPLEIDSSLQSGSHRKESPWAVEPPLLEKLRQMPLNPARNEPPAEPELPSDAPSAEKAAKPPTKTKWPAIRPKKPSYGEEIDPEFGNFLEGLE